MIVALAGGVGAARLLRGMVEVVAPSEITAIVNTGDDTDLQGLHISPDLDTVMYTLADAINPETGWGLARRDLACDGVARHARRGHLVQPRRSGSGHPSLPDSTPERGSPPGSGHLRAGRVVRRRRDPGAGHRRPAAHPCPVGRRPRSRVPGVLRPAPPRGPGVGHPLRRRRPGHAGPRGARGPGPW